MTDKQGKISCNQCRHYFVTWEKDFPYGCRAMGFKSKIAATFAVFQSSGIPCQHFEPKGKQMRSKP
jgi:hypothetical protein